MQKKAHQNAGAPSLRFRYYLVSKAAQRASTNSTSSGLQYIIGRDTNLRFFSSRLCETPLPATNSDPSGITIASTRSKYRIAEALKSPLEKSNTLNETSGCKNRSTLFDSMMTFSAFAIRSRTRGIASCNCPCRVLTQNDCAAPAARYREESVPLSRFLSSLIAIV